MEIAQWIAPSAEYRSAPFWSWNGEMKPEVLREHIEKLRAGGMGGFFMHSRPGLKTDFMGEEWMRCVEACIEKARETGMNACLYDEDTYASGAGAGYVTHDHPEFRGKTLVLRPVCPLSEGEQRLARFDITWQDGYLAEYCRTDQGVYAFDVVCKRPRAWWGNDAVADSADPDAVRRFIELCYEPYAQRFSEEFGRAVPYIFTDEVQLDWLEYQWLIGKSEYRPEVIAAAYWTAQEAERFERMWGYSLLDRLPELFYRRKGEPFSTVSFQYFRTLNDLLERAYFQQVGDWCDRHSLGLTGHLFLSGFGSVLYCGMPMQQLRHFAMPGVDILTDAVHKVAAVKMVSSLCNQTGKKRMICELYGATGWDWPLEKHKFHGDWQYCLGVNFRCQHLTHYTLSGTGKRDYPASIGHHSPWWKYYPTVEDYFGRLSYLLSEGKSANHILVVEPQECLMGYYAGLHLKDTGTNDARIADCSDRWEKINRALTDAHFLFDYGEELLLAELGRVTDKGLAVGEMNYTEMVLLPSDSIRSTTVDLLENSHFPVTVVGDLPRHMDGVPSARPSEVLRHRKNVTFVRTAEELLSTLPRRVSVRSGEREEYRLWCMRRENAWGTLLFIAPNVFGFTGECTVAAELEAPMPYAYRMNAADGTFERLPVEYEEKTAHLQLKIEPGESYLLLFSQQEFPVSHPYPLPECSEKRTIIEALRYSLSEDNTLPLDTCTYALGDGAGSQSMTVSQAEQQILQHYGLPTKGFYQSGQPWKLYHRGIVDVSPRDTLTLNFTFHVSVLPGRCALGLEPQPGFHVTVNGKPLPTENTPFIDDFIRRYDVTDLLVEGENTVRVTGVYRADVELENLYLIGDFGVWMQDDAQGPRYDNYTVGVLPECLKPGRLMGQGLDFYTGSVLYHLPQGYRRLVVEDDHCTCAVLHMGGETIVKAWGRKAFDLSRYPADSSPVLELIFGRENLFGPLHVKITDIVEPEDFDYGNRNWQEQYVPDENSSGQLVLMR